jgi:antitoxin CptB
MSEDIDVRRKRATWRAGHRGTKELDFLVGRFADARLGSMSGADLDHFEQFLALADPEIQSWLLGPLREPEAEFAALVAEIRKFHGLA